MICSLAKAYFGSDAQSYHDPEAQIHVLMIIMGYRMVDLIDLA
jgi:hypothetical protein